MSLIDELVRAIAEAAGRDDRPCIVALDGRSGAGKSTLAAAARARTGAQVIEGDDFYSGGDAAQWDAMSADEKVAHCMDWRRQRPVLESLRRGEAATWHPYDWEVFTDQLSATSITCPAAQVIMLEGAYSARPELADLLDLRVLLDTEDGERRRRLRDREGDEYLSDWERRWSEAEDHYFGTVMPASAFDLVLHDPPA